MTSTVGVVIPAYRPKIEQLTSYITDIDEQIEPERIHIEIDVPRRAVLEELQELPVTIGIALNRRGKGAAVTAGFESMDTDVLAFADADGSTSVKSLAAVIDKVRNRETDISAGSRRHPKATITAQETFMRRRMGDVFVWLTRRLITPDLNDYQCGAKALSREAWQTVREHLYESGFGWDVELLAMADTCGLRVEEVPVVWTDHPDSTVSPFRTPITMTRTLLSVRSRAKHIQQSPLHYGLTVRPSRPVELINRRR